MYGFIWDWDGFVGVLFIICNNFCFDNINIWILFVLSFWLRLELINLFNKKLIVL